MKLLDIVIGLTANCWFVAGIACLAISQKKHLLDNVIPPDQDFDKDYVGLFTQLLLKHLMCYWQNRYRTHFHRF